MGLRILVGLEQGDSPGQEKAVMMDSVTGWAFGPVFEGVAHHENMGEPALEAEAFVAWCIGHENDYADITGYEYQDAAELFEGSPHADPRAIPEAHLERLYAEWRGRQRERDA